MHSRPAPRARLCSHAHGGGAQLMLHSACGALHAGGPARRHRARNGSRFGVAAPVLRRPGARARARAAPAPSCNHFSQAQGYSPSLHAFASETASRRFGLGGFAGARPSMPVFNPTAVVKSSPPANSNLRPRAQRRRRTPSRILRTPPARCALHSRAEASFPPSLPDERSIKHCA